MLNSKADEKYILFFVNEYWYYFFRLHHILCDRLGKMCKQAKILANDRDSEKLKQADKSAARLLRLKANCNFVTFIIIFIIIYLFINFFSGYGK